MEDLDVLKSKPTPSERLKRITLYYSNQLAVALVAVVGATIFYS